MRTILRRKKIQRESSDQEEDLETAETTLWKGPWTKEAVQDSSAALVSRTILKCSLRGYPLWRGKREERSTQIEIAKKVKSKNKQIINILC